MRMPIPFLISLGMLLTMTFLSVGLWSALPADMMLPIHFDWLGTPDGFARPAVALFLLPAVMLGVIAVFTIAPMVRPQAINSPALYVCIWLVAILIISAAHGLVIRQALFALKG
ncbi:Protein of unknown function [Rhizobium sp. NFR07]|uniref:DUF1648 domain-containing protein n=1 Tax=Rhizobium sp. NFR07 TaxID=1566262 RepID=UPI0008E78D11|nr:DUF1648 domain-containing protein [Rhizobium sp. NFR07]SFB64248.1 Protein of unknown function [Rhizobium sp. NFR07]